MTRDLPHFPGHTFVAVVCYGRDYRDRGVLLRDAAGLRWVAWHDGYGDHVTRRGSRLTMDGGARLRVVSRSKRDALPILAAHRAAIEAMP